MAALQIEGYVIVSAEGMLANAAHVMPDELKFEGDKRFFTEALDRADLIVHGRHSFEDQPNSPKRTRIWVTRSIASLAPDPSNPKATLWNPAGAPFEAACEQAGVKTGKVAIIGGPVVFAMFLDRYETFWLSQAPQGADTRWRRLFSGRSRAVAAGDPGGAWPEGRRSANPRRGPRGQRHAVAAAGLGLTRR